MQISREIKIKCKELEEKGEYYALSISNIDGLILFSIIHDIDEYAVIKHNNKIRAYKTYYDVERKSVHQNRKCKILSKRLHKM